MVINVFIILCCLVAFFLYITYSENRHPLPSFIIIFIVISQLSIPLGWYIEDLMGEIDFQATASYRVFKGITSPNGWPSFAIYFRELHLWQWIFSLLLTYIIVFRKKVLSKWKSSIWNIK